MSKKTPVQGPLKFSSPDSSWDPESFLWDRVRELLARHWGVGPSVSSFERCVKDIRGAATTIEVTFRGLENGSELVATMDALAVWLVNRLLSTPDGIDSVIEGIQPDPSSVGSPLYNACLETMRTSRGAFFTAEEIAERIHYGLAPRRRRLRQLRRLLQRVCQQNNGRVRRESRAKVTYGLR